FNARADTLFLFAATGDGSFGSPGTNARGYTFDHNGGKDEAGWFSLDKTAQADNYWHLADANLVDGHVTDMTDAGEPWSGGDASNDWSLWCGRENVCGWASPNGYGNNWNQYLVIESANFSDSLNIHYAYNADFEGDTWDFFQVFIDVDGEMEEVYRNTVGAEGIYQDVEHTVLESDYPGATFGNITMRFSTDGAWADEDGLFTSDIGAVWIDNVELIHDTVVTMQEDFEGGVAPSEFFFTSPPGAGDFADLYQNLYSEDICITNITTAWAFFDLNTTNPNYPIPVTPYGPPYFDTDIRSPILESAHGAGDASGVPVVVDAETQVWLEYQIYYDLPQNALVYESWGVAAQTQGVPCLGVYKNDNVVIYGDSKQWTTNDINVTQYVAESAQGGVINGIGVALNTVDMCPFWCNTNGDGTGHTPAPYFDNVVIKLISASAIAWDVSRFDRFQDNFPEPVGGKVRIDSCNDVGDIASNSPVVIGDSTMVELNMDLVGGMKTHFNAAAGETRPDFRLWFRVSEGPNAGTLSASMADQDASDGIYSPWDGIQNFDGEDWGTMVTDSASTTSGIVQGKYAFDFNDDFFEPGDIIEFFYRAEAVTGELSHRPGYAMSSNPDLRSYYTVRCLPTTGATMLFCDDANGTFFWWNEAFRYNGYSGYDTYLTQAPSSGLENGLAGRAEIADLAQYDMIVWDSGGVPTGTVTNSANNHKTEDDVLLTDYIENSTHDTGLWMMGDLIGNDLGNGSAFFSNVLGANLMSAGQFYDDYTGILVPQVNATHAALEVGGLEPYFWVYGGCPNIRDFSVVEPSGVLSAEAFAWDDDGGTTMVAGILNRDPDGDSSPTSAAGWDNHVVYNPFSYVRVRDSDFALDNGFDLDYARQSVGDVLGLLFGFQANMAPDDAGTVPARTELSGNFPNPFNPKTTIKFALASEEHVHLSVYDLSGRVVKTLVNGSMLATDHEVVWDGKNENGDRIASGVYFYKLVAGDYTATEKMVMLK
ncbi:MAG: T9SS type A sorting domain-containing protein, partial [bacterium]|nr:T9SS type A sorting domain-containing protein [bacterium]